MLAACSSSGFSHCRMLGPGRAKAGPAPLGSGTAVGRQLAGASWLDSRRPRCPQSRRGLHQPSETSLILALRYPRSHPDFANEFKRDHFDLATCLHFVLSGIDPFCCCAFLDREVESIRQTLTAGRGKVGQGAEVLSAIIQEGWAGEAAST
ncbi:hypothetical protein VTK56DRAFT_4019 [Thermocarpiscus australiensis]